MTGNRTPAANPATPVNRQQLERDTAAALASQTYGPSTIGLDATIRAKNYQKLLTILPDYSDETLQRFAVIALTDIGANLNEFICNARPPEEYVNDWITTHPIAIKGRINAPHVIHGLTDYKNLEPQKKGHYPPRRIEQITALTTVSAHLWSTGDGITFGVDKNQNPMLSITDKKLRDLLTTNEDPAAIADIIVARNITDPEQITALHDLINETTHALAAGTL